MIGLSRDTTAADCRNRHGGIALMSACVIVMILAFAAFTVDVGLITLVKTEMQTVADASALAGSAELLGPLLDRRAASDPKTLQAMSDARDAAVVVAGSNPSGYSAGTTLDRDTDIRFGNRAWNPVTGKWTTQWNVWPYNTVEITARRSTALGTGLPLSFAPTIGHSSADVTERAVAAIMPIAGITSTNCVPVPIMPFLFDADSWLDLETNGGPDDFSYDEATKSVVRIPDGIPEIAIFPNGEDDTLPSGNRGTVNLGGWANSTAVLADQIVNGIDCTELSYHGGSLDFSKGPLVLTGDPGLSTALKAPLNQVVGLERAIFLFTGFTGNGDTTEYSVSAIVGVRIMSVSLTGASSHRGLIVQPASLCLASGLPGKEPMSKLGTVYVSPRLVE